MTTGNLNGLFIGPPDTRTAEEKKRDVILGRAARVLGLAFKHVTGRHLAWHFQNGGDSFRKAFDEQMLTDRAKLMGASEKISTPLDASAHSDPAWRNTFAIAGTIARSVQVRLGTPAAAPDSPAVEK